MALDPADGKVTFGGMSTSLRLDRCTASEALAGLRIIQNRVFGVDRVPGVDVATLTLHAGARASDVSVKVATDAYLFNAFGEELFPVREVKFVGGESVAYHTNAAGEIDYLESHPSSSGAATDHYSPFANWSETLTPSELLSRLSRSVAGVGAITDLRVRQRAARDRRRDARLR